VGPSRQDTGDLLIALRAVPDPRPGGARRHPTVYVLAVLVMSFACAGFASFTGAAQWAARPPTRLCCCGIDLRTTDLRACGCPSTGSVAT